MSILLMKRSLGNLLHQLVVEDEQETSEKQSQNNHKASKLWTRHVADNETT